MKLAAEDKDLGKKIILGMLVLVLIVGVYGRYFRHAKPRLNAVDELVGTGPEAANKHTVVIDYQAFLFDPAKFESRGKKFDSTYDRHQAMQATLGKSALIPGLEQGLVGMRVGGRRRIRVPASLGYGAQGAGGGLVPPDSELLYVVELKQVL